MTNATDPPSGFLRWEVPGKTISICLGLNVVERLEREVLEAFKAVTKRGSEIGGILLGRAAPGPQRIVTIEQYISIECEYARGPLYLMSEDDRKRFSEALANAKAASGEISAVGFFRSNTRRDLVLDDDDLEIAREYFADPGSAFLLVKPFAMKPSTGAFFFWEDGQIKADETYLTFPFKRTEIEKSLSGSIILPDNPLFSAFRKAAAPAAPPAPPKQEAAPPKVEERKPAPPPPPPAMKREERPPVSAAPPPPPVAPKREERPPVTVAARKDEAQKEAASVKPAAPPARKEEKPGAAPLPFKREERAPVTPIPKPEQRPAGPILVKKDEPAAKSDKSDEKPPVRRDDRPAVTPVTVRGGAAAAPAPLPEPPVVPAASVPVPEPIAPPTFGAPRVDERSRGDSERKPGIFANKFFWIAVVVILLLSIGGYFVYRTMMGSQPVQTAADSLSLKVDRNAGQLLLSWNRNATAIQGASRATLSISDGDHKEDVDLDLGQLRSGSIVYSPLTNDVSFRLEVADLKGGKSVSESVRVLAGRPSPAPQQLPQQAAQVPVNVTPAQVESPKETAPPKTEPQQSLAANTQAQQPAAVTATPAVTAQPPQPQSLAARLSAPALIEAPVLDSGSSLPTNATIPSSIPTAAPPPEPARTTPTSAQQTASSAAQNAVRVGGQVQEARLLKRDIPVYPPLARQARVTGTVRVEATIGTDGRVKAARAISGPPLLRQAAAESVKKWMYSPALLNGQPTEVTTQVDLLFSPGR